MKGGAKVQDPFKNWRTILTGDKDQSHNSHQYRRPDHLNTPITSRIFLGGKTTYNG